MFSNACPSSSTCSSTLTLIMVSYVIGSESRDDCRVSDIEQRA